MNDYPNHTIERVLSKDDKVYVEDPSEVPEGAKLEIGPEGGMYYHRKTVEEFQEYVESFREEVFEEHPEIDRNSEEVQQAEALADEYDEVANDQYRELVSVMEEAGVNVKGGSYRVKDPVSMVEKTYRKDHYEEIDDLKDNFGARLYADMETIEQAAEAIQDHFGDDIIDESNTLRDPQDGYYRAYHANFEFADGKVGELQLKTPEAAEIADVGHTVVYKENYDHGDVSEEEAEKERQEVADCLTASMDMVMGEEPSTNGCTETATQIIQDVMGYT